MHFHITTSRLIVLMPASNFQSTVSTAPSRVVACLFSERQSTAFRFPGVQSCLGEGRFPVDIVLALTEQGDSRRENPFRFFFSLTISSLTTARPQHCYFRRLSGVTSCLLILRPPIDFMSPSNRILLCAGVVNRVGGM